ncbi:SDR family NAD(P)-dependent oxidoreductase [Alicyclobacillus fastidiosus]|uniref:SDR family NAD(P)-dependent oxidoreductase n=1 Tax=Alicyclobacillus fastidiosus TaxID=392011 RepID=A0ABV5AG52_9BACL|nr:SDR family NAD(P)-dependent oxidoreductase [Alicyclobacillus fastidiosus]WEH08890.1 SDR family NAD(P)-dependent oxidoreductase [Alicyclobacillus fastidiosus]
MGWQNTTVLVTGAAGFIGSHLLEQLLAAGARTKAFVHYNSANTRGYIDQLPAEQQKEIEIIYGDLRDAYAVSHAVKGSDVVFHLGALIAIPYSYQNPYDVVQTNALGTFHVAQAALEHGVGRIVHTSTSEVYGTARYVPMNEEHPLQGQSPYSASKIAADKIMESFHCSYQLPVVTIRPFNSYGPRQSMRAVIPTIINQALSSSEVVLGNLSSTRDFTYVEDTARAFLCAATAQQVTGQVFNAGSSFEISIGDIAKRVLTLVGRSVPIRTAQERLRPAKSEVDRLYSDSRRAQQQLGWQPLVSFDDGLQRTIDWISQHPQLYRPNEYVV